MIDARRGKLRTFFSGEDEWKSMPFMDDAFSFFVDEIQHDYNDERLRLTLIPCIGPNGEEIQSRFLRRIMFGASWFGIPLEDRTVVVLRPKLLKAELDCSLCETKNMISLINRCFICLDFFVGKVFTLIIEDGYRVHLRRAYLQTRQKTLPRSIRRLEPILAAFGSPTLIRTSRYLEGLHSSMSFDLTKPRDRSWARIST